IPRGSFINYETDPSAIWQETLMEAMDVRITLEIVRTLQNRVRPNVSYLRRFGAEAHAQLLGDKSFDTLPCYLEEFRPLLDAIPFWQEPEEEGQRDYLAAEKAYREYLKDMQDLGSKPGNCSSDGSEFIQFMLNLF